MNCLRASALFLVALLVGCASGPELNTKEQRADYWYDRGAHLHETGLFVGEGKRAGSHNIYYLLFDARKNYFTYRRWELGVVYEGPFSVVGIEAMASPTFTELPFTIAAPRHLLAPSSDDSIRWVNGLSAICESSIHKYDRVAMHAFAVGEKGSVLNSKSLTGMRMAYTFRGEFMAGGCFGLDSISDSLGAVPIDTALTSEGRRINNRFDVVIYDPFLFDLRFHRKTRMNSPLFTENVQADATILAAREKARKEKLLRERARKEAASRALVKKQKDLKPPVVNAPIGVLVDDGSSSSFAIARYKEMGSAQYSYTGPSVDFKGYSIAHQTYDVMGEAGYDDRKHRLDFGLDKSCVLRHRDVHAEKGFFDFKWFSNDGNYDVSSYLRNMHRTVMYGRVGDHGVSVSPVAITKGYEVDVAPVIKVHRSFYRGGKMELVTTSENRAIVYRGDRALVFRIYVSDPRHPVSCIDLLIDEDKGEVIDGRMFYLHNGKLEAKRFIPLIL